jgi:PPM family protein phosphatase
VEFLKRWFGRPAMDKPAMDKIDVSDADKQRTYSDPAPVDTRPAGLGPDAEEPAKAHSHSIRPFRAGYATHAGCVRSRNEDSVLALTLALHGERADLACGLFMVADGMGGHSEGQKASQLATRIVAKEVMGRLFGPFLQIDNSEAPGPVLTTLTESLQMANWRINRDNPESGTTLTAGLVVGNRLYMAHVGDSRAYLIGGGESDLEPVTLDHSFVQRLQDTGQISAEEALVHPQRNLLYRAVGQGDKLEIDTFSRVIPRPGWLLICSDGLWGVVGPEVLIETVTAVQHPQQICDELVSAALEAGAPDNVSLVAIRFEGPSAEAPAAHGAGIGR